MLMNVNVFLINFTCLTGSGNKENSGENDLLQIRGKKREKERKDRI